MKNLTKKASYWAMTLSCAFLFACSDDSDNSSPGGGNPTGAGINTYSGSATYGDLVTFSINKDNQSYELYNETTDQTESGSYTVLKNEFEGIYEVNANGSSFFGVELDEKIVVANFPSGNANNDLSFGVSSEIDNSSQLSSMTGNYFYVTLGSYLQSKAMEWGQFSLTSDSLHLISMSDGNYGPEDTTINFPITYAVSDNDASWTLSGSKSDRLDLDFDGDKYTGYAYAAGKTAVFLIDLGTGEGTVIAYKVDPSASLSSIAGDYKYIEFYQDGEKAAGNYTLSADGSVSYSYTNGNPLDVELNQHFLSQFQQVNAALPNVYYATGVDTDGSNVYFVVAGDAIMHYHFDASYNFQGYGAGAKL
jgi:hypothetical protein